MLGWFSSWELRLFGSAWWFKREHSSNWIAAARMQFGFWASWRNALLGYFAGASAGLSCVVGFL